MALVCIVFWCCIYVSIVVFSKAYVIGLRHLSWILLLAVCVLWSHLPHGWSSSRGIFLLQVVCLVLLFLCYCSRSLHLPSFCLQLLLATALYCQMLHSMGTAFCFSFAEVLLLDLHLMHLIPGIIVPLLNSSWLFSWVCHIGFTMCCSMSINILVISVS